MTIPANASNESNLYWHNQEDDAIGIITAFSVSLSLDENSHRSQQLESMIRALHFGFDKCEGHYVEGETGDVAEETFVVYSEAEHKDDLKKLLDEVVIAFEQDAYIYAVDGKAALVRRNGEVEDLGDFGFSPANLGSLYSKTKHAAFHFGDVVEGCQYRTKSLGQGDSYRYLTTRKMLRESNGDFCAKYDSKFRDSEE